MQGKKYDGDKPMVSLFPAESILATARVLTFGAKKYSRDNWKFVANAEQRYLDAAMRHMLDYTTGNKIDAESGENHLAHAMCCLAFLLYADETGHQFPLTN